MIEGQAGKLQRLRRERREEVCSRHPVRGFCGQRIRAAEVIDHNQTLKRRQRGGDLRDLLRLVDGLAGVAVGRPR